MCDECTWHGKTPSAAVLTLGNKAVLRCIVVIAELSLSWRHVHSDMTVRGKTVTIILHPSEGVRR